MKHSRFVKVSVLSFFILFLIAFVAYRTGAFDKWSNQKSAADHDMEMNTVMANQDISLNSLSVIDSPPVAKRTIMPSSKSMALPLDKSVYLKLDTGFKAAASSERAVIFSGSKSGPVIPPVSIPSKISIEQLLQAYELEQQRKIDSLNKVKGAEDTVVFEPYFPSSKSGRLIIVPKQKAKK
jgi:hypothetical protein